MRCAAFCLLLVSCSAPVGQHIDWYGDPRFTDAERAEVERGTAWLYAHACLPAPRISWDDDVSVVAQYGYPTINKTRGGDSDGLCAGSRIFLNTATIEPRLLGAVTAHEMGHCVLGFEDRLYSNPKRTDGIMRILDPMRWTSNEDEQCAVHAQCRCNK